MILGSSSASKCLVGQRPSRHGHASCPIFAIWRSPIIHLVCPPKLCITFVFHFSWVLQSSQQKLTTMFMQSVFWGGRGEERGGGKQGALLNDNLRSGPILAVLIHSLLSAPALFSFRPARRSVIFKAKRK